MSNSALISKTVLAHANNYWGDREGAKINKIINMPDGVFLVTGPTGSGKTTSLYAFLNRTRSAAHRLTTA